MMVLLSSIVAPAALTFACGVWVGFRLRVSIPSVSIPSVSIPSVSIPSKSEFWRLDGTDLKWHERGCKKLERRSFSELVKGVLCSECELVLESEFCKLCYRKKQK